MELHGPPTFEKLVAVVTAGLLSGGFIWVFGLLYRSRVPKMERGRRYHGSVAAGDRIVARRCGYSEVEIDRAIANRTGKPGRAGADIAGLSGRPVVFCGRSGAGSASSDRPALRRARRGRRPAGCARRSPSPGQGTDDHAGGQGMAGVAGVPEGKGPR